MARTTILNDTIASAIVEAAEQGATLKASAQAAGVTYESLRDWRNRGKRGEGEPFASFAARLEKAIGHAQLKMIRVVQTAALGGTWQAAAWWLERRYHKQWGRKDTLTQRAAITKATDISDAEYEKLLLEEQRRLQAKKSA